MEKGGLTDAVQALKLSAHAVITFADELRVGLMGTVRRVLAPRGVKVRQRVQMARKWRYLVLAVDGRQGRLYWGWSPSMKSVDLAPTVQDWNAAGVQAVVWDGATGHGGPEVAEIGLPRIKLPPVSPELNPTERVFEYIRDRIEGHMYDTIDDKVAKVEEILAELAVTPARVQSLAGWDWIHDALARVAMQVA